MDETPECHSDVPCLSGEAVSLLSVTFWVTFLHRSVDAAQGEVIPFSNTEVIVGLDFGAFYYYRGVIRGPEEFSDH